MPRATSGRVPLAGDVYRVNLSGKGHEQHGHRPMIVIQDDDAAGLSTRLCVPTSSSADPARWRVGVTIDDDDTLALVEQLRAISNEQLRPDRLMGRLSYQELADIRTMAARLIGIV